MTNLFLSLYIVMALSSASMAYAGDDEEKKTTAAPAATNLDIEKLCAKEKREKPFRGLVPIPPEGAAPGQPMKLDDSMEASLRFKQCLKARAASGSPEKNALCDSSLAKIIIYNSQGTQAYDDTLDGVCKNLASIKQKKCEDQKDALTCAKDEYLGAGGKLTKLSTTLKEKSEALHRAFLQHEAILKQEMPKIVAAKPAQKAAVEKFIRASSAPTSVSTITGADQTVRKNLITGCINEVKNELFCNHFTAASETRIFAEAFNVQFKKSADLGKKLTAAGTVAGTRENSGGDVTGKSGGGMGLDDLLKVATLGVAGATAYCSMTGKCSPKKDEAPANASTIGGATSPAAPAAAPEVAKSSTGEPVKSSPASPVDAIPKVEPTNYGGGSSHDSGSGFSLSKNDPAYAAKDSGGGHSPASTGPVGGGGGGSGNGGGGLGADTSGGAHDPFKSSDTLAPNAGGGLPGGGGGGSAGGFSLSDSKAPSGADAALKNILNGEGAPIGDPALNPLDDPKEGLKLGSDGLGFDDPENLFFRVRGTHVRCLKRGCVGQGVGDHI